MPHDWEASRRRIGGTIAGSDKIDRVPYFPIVCEEIICRISGKTFRELLSFENFYLHLKFMEMPLL
ncbi:MAG: hypothetical protein ACTSPZ_05765 [Promethearchaeota archaeon]